MTRTVLTYQAPAQLLRSDSLFQKYYSDCLHIVATNSLKTGLGESIRDSRWIKAPVITFSELFSEISGEKWSSSKAQLTQFLKLSEVISGLWEQNHEENLLILQSLERNQLQVLKTMRTLTELGLIPNNFINLGQKLTASEESFLKMWSEMKILQNSTEQLQLFLKGETNVLKTMKLAIDRWSSSIFEEENKKSQAAKVILKRRNSNLPAEDWKKFAENSLEKKKLILHGFYFITPIQERIFNRLEDVYELVFLNAYDSRFPQTFETVKTFLGIDKNQTSKVVPDNIPIHPLASKLVESFEGASKIQVNQEVLIYSDLSHFVEAEKKGYHAIENGTAETDDTYHLITPRAKEVEKHLIANELVTPTKEKLTDYPIGRYLYRLHQMRSRENDLDLGTVTFKESVTAKALLDCFSSGCLIVDGEDMKVYVKPLEKIIPYCKNIKTFDQWQSQIEKLVSEKEWWEQKIMESNPYALSERTHKFHSLPMNQLSYFSVSKKDIKKILLGINALKQINFSLFSNFETSKTDISTHLKKLEQLVLKGVEEYFENDEKAIVNQLIKDISQLKDEELEFSLKDISKGLMFYLDGTLEEINDLETVVDKVFSFDHADGAPFRTNRKFHLAFADNKAFPIPQGYNLWPISRKTVEYLGDDYPELGLLEERKKQSGSITRYLLYVLIHSADDIRLSYAKNLGSESRLEPSVYLKLLECEISNVTREDKEIEKIFKDNHESINLKDVGWTISMEREAKVCGKRSSFSFIMNEYPTHTSDFNHGFLYQNYIDVFNQLVDNKLIPSSDIRNIIDPWFPQWNNMKRSLLYASRYIDRKSKYEKVILNGQKYSQAISYLQLIPNSYGDIKSRDLNNGEIALHEANPGKHCRYCPYISICKDGVYPIDYDEKQSFSDKESMTLNSVPNSSKKEKRTYNEITKNQDTFLNEYLTSKKLSVLDKREKGGCIWIIGGKNLEPIIDELKTTMNITFKFAPNGGKTTKMQPAWYLSNI